MEQKHDMQPKGLHHPKSAVTGQPIASIHNKCKNGCGLVGQVGDWTKVARGVRYWNSTLSLGQIPCDTDYPTDSDKNWKRE